MVNKHLELVKRHARDYYGRFIASPTSRATPLLLPCTRRWEGLAAAAPLLLPRVCRMWEAIAAAASLLLPHTRRRLHRMTPWRCGDSSSSSSSFGMPGDSSSSSIVDMPGGGFIIWWLPIRLLKLQRWMPPCQRGELMWTASRFQLFSTITKCVHIHFQI
jgi:hypothetical protein